MDCNPTQDLHMSIGEVAKQLGVSVETIRLYEREGLILPHRSVSKRRYYDAVDLCHLRLIRKLITKENLSISGIRWLYSLIPCWEIHGCAEHEKIRCPAYTTSRKPCWFIKEETMGSCLVDDCRQCEVYQTADHYILHKHAMQKHPGGRG